MIKKYLKLEEIKPGEEMFFDNPENSKISIVVNYIDDNLQRIYLNDGSYWPFHPNKFYIVLPDDESTGYKIKPIETKPEPSRLEIAKDIFCSMLGKQPGAIMDPNDLINDSLRVADVLMLKEKETRK